MRSLVDWFLSRDAIAGRSVGASFGLLVLRVGIGLMMAVSHGWGKLTGFGERSATFFDPFGVGSAVSLSLAVFAEFFCALALVVGLGTRFAVIPLIITMLTAAFIAHAADPWPKQELALMYLTPFLTLLFTGPGKFSLDYVIARK